MAAMTTLWVRSIKGTHFTTGIVQNAVETESLPSGISLYKPVGVIRRVIILSKENLDWEIMFWGNGSYNTGDCDTEIHYGSKKFIAANGSQIGAAGIWRYDSGELNIRYEDLTKTQLLHCAICNRSVAAKTAGAAGEMTVLVEIGGQ